MATHSAGGERICFIHIGAPKTGSTGIQHFLVKNAALLASAGILYPSAGRCSWRPGHHEFTTQLRETPELDARTGPIGEVLSEIVSGGPERVIISAEDLVLLDEGRDVFTFVRDAFAAIGYRSKIVLYVRAHDEYVESIYCEAVKHGLTLPFERYLDGALQHGELQQPGMRFPFAFMSFVSRFAPTFGPENLIVRGYRNDGDPVMLVRDFLTAIGADTRSIYSSISWPAQYENPRLTTADVIRRLYASSAGQLGEAPVTSICEPLIAREPEAADMPFAPLGPADCARLSERFAGDAELLVRDWGVDPRTFHHKPRDSDAASHARDLFFAAEKLRALR